MILNRIETYRIKKVEFWSSRTEYPLDKAIKNAKRLNKKREKESPLLAFAGQLDQIIPEDLKKRYDISNKNYCEKHIHGVNDRAAKASMLVKQVSILLNDEIELARLNLYRVHTYPDDLVYDLEYWNKVLNRKDK
jgi:hypothetical protein